MTEGGIVMNKLFYIIVALGLVMLLDLSKNPLGPDDPMLETTLLPPVFSAEQITETPDEMVMSYPEVADSLTWRINVPPPLTDAYGATAPGTIR
jgi:hypothetical protein